MADEAVIDLPHRGPARLLREARVGPAGEIVGVGAVPGDSPYVIDGEVPAYVALELAAQLAAASASGSGGPAFPVAQGYLVRVRSVEMYQARLPVDVDWTVHLVPGGSAGGLTGYDAEVRVGDREVVRCAFSTYVPPQA